MKRRMDCLTGALIFLASVLAARIATAESVFKVRGIGGAGGMFVPSISPYDSDFMMVACDMSGSYRSVDGGTTWELIHYMQMNRNAHSARPAYFRDRVFWNRGAELRVSRDRARTWRKVRAQPWGPKTKIASLTPVPEGSGILLVSTDRGIWRTDDDGTTWSNVLDGEITKTIAFGGTVYSVGVPNRLHISSDAGKTWTTTTLETKGGKVFSFTGGKGADGVVLFASAWKVGIMRSRDGGKTWDVVVDKYEDQNDLQMAHNQTRIVFAAQTGGRWCKKVWRSVDGGGNWEDAFRLSGPRRNVEPSWVQTQLRWGYYITRRGFCVSAASPNLAIVTTQGDFYVTRDGGRSWRQQMNEIVGVLPGDPGIRYRCTGLEVTSCWEYLFDPFDKNREYIAYTDIGFARSTDNGKTWAWSAKGSPWTNTFYDVVFDPEVSGRMYAATSNRHDIPHWTHITPNNPQRHQGGLCISDDHAVTWRPSCRGLPRLPCTSVCLDPTSPRDNRVLYVTVFGEGVYKSINGGTSWTKKSNGLGNPGNLHAYRVRRHAKTGDLYCLITANRHGRDFPVPGGLWKSTDGAESWTDMTKNVSLAWPTNFAFDRDDPSRIYITAATIPGSPQGGVYRTTNGGKTWKHVLTDEMLRKSGGAGYDHTMCVFIHPDDKNLVYAGTTSHGLWFSRDGGDTWRHYRAFPFGNAQSIRVGPTNHNLLYVTTFGAGVWTGPHLPE
ncbi:MAG: hypothetical protein GXP31_17470 [Kiritimatiellaeota bacterium]|nr:hypothetical protein [Kiritimatiellota bacterium]